MRLRGRLKKRTILSNNSQYGLHNEIGVSSTERGIY